MNFAAPSPYVVRVHADWRGPRPGRPLRLGNLNFELTERCNNDCIHCCINLPAADAEARRRELSTGNIQALLTEAAALGALSVGFTGGEPLLREDFVELYLFARRLGLKVVLFTNARLITPELADLLARVPPREPIEVTVYGMRRESYEAVARRPGSFEEFRRGIELLLARDIPVVVKGALLPPNREELEAFEAWAATLPAMDSPPAYAMFFDLRYRRDSLAKNRLIQGLRPTAEEGVAMLRRRGGGYHKEMRDFCSRFMGPAGERLFACGMGHDACVDTYGGLKACLPLGHPDTVYDLKTGSLGQALNEFFPRLRETRAENPDYLARCARCFLKGLCEQCPAKSWTEHGTLDTPVEYLCRLAHAQARDLGLLQKGEWAWEVEDWRERQVDGG